MATFHAKNEEEVEDILLTSEIGNTIIMSHRNGPKKYKVVSTANGKQVEPISNRNEVQVVPKQVTKERGSFKDLRNDKQLSRGMHNMTFSLPPKHTTILHRSIHKKTMKGGKRQKSLKKQKSLKRRRTCKKRNNI
jgi:hypothetical protein